MAGSIYAAGNRQTQKQSFQFPCVRAPKADGQTSVVEVQDLLCELRDLLDAYGPVWYTEKHHDRITASATFLRRMEGDPATSRRFDTGS